MQLAGLHIMKWVFQCVVVCVVSVLQGQGGSNGQEVVTRNYRQASWHSSNGATGSGGAHQQQQSFSHRSPSSIPSIKLGSVGGRASNVYYPSAGSLEFGRQTFSQQTSSPSSLRRSRRRPPTSSSSFSSNSKQYQYDGTGLYKSDLSSSSLFPPTRSSSYQRQSNALSSSSSSPRKPVSGTIRNFQPSNPPTRYRLPPPRRQQSPTIKSLASIANFVPRPAPQLPTSNAAAVGEAPKQLLTPPSSMSNSNPYVPVPTPIAGEILTPRSNSQPIHHQFHGGASNINQDQQQYPPPSDRYPPPPPPKTPSGLILNPGVSNIRRGPSNSRTRPTISSIQPPPSINTIIEQRFEGGSDGNPPLPPRPNLPPPPIFFGPSGGDVFDPDEPPLPPPFPPKIRRKPPLFDHRSITNHDDGHLNSDAFRESPPPPRRLVLSDHHQQHHQDRHMPQQSSFQPPRPPPMISNSIDDSFESIQQQISLQALLPENEFDDDTPNQVLQPAMSLPIAPQSPLPSSQTISRFGGSSASSNQPQQRSSSVLLSSAANGQDNFISSSSTFSGGRGFQQQQVPPTRQSTNNLRTTSSWNQSNQLRSFPEQSSAFVGAGMSTRRSSISEFNSAGIISPSSSSSDSSLPMPPNFRRSATAPRPPKFEYVHQQQGSSLSSSSFSGDGGVPKNFNPPRPPPLPNPPTNRGPTFRPIDYFGKGPEMKSVNGRPVLTSKGQSCPFINGRKVKFREDWKYNLENNNYRVEIDVMPGIISTKDLDFRNTFTKLTDGETYCFICHYYTNTTMLITSELKCLDDYYPVSISSDVRLSTGELHLTMSMIQGSNGKSLDYNCPIESFRVRSRHGGKVTLLCWIR